MRRHVPIAIRILGLFLAGISIYIWLKGGSLSTFRYKGIILTLPIEIVLAVIAIVLLISPEIAIRIIALITPAKKRKIILDLIPPQESSLATLTGSPNPAKLADVLSFEIRRLDRRFYTFLIIFILLLSLGLPFLIDQIVSISRFNRESNRFVQLIQNTRIEFSYADIFREHLNELETYGGIIAKERTATMKLVEILKRLYISNVMNSIDFEYAITDIYNKEIKPYVISETGTLNMDRFHFTQSSFESPSASITLLSVLGHICNQEGDHGNLVDPYIQARQFLQLIFDDHSSAKSNLALAYNAEGIANWGLLKCYEQYKSKFFLQSGALDIFLSSVKESSPRSRLNLVRRAIAAYTKAVEQSNTNLVKARSLNNQVDLQITFLNHIYFENGIDKNDIRDSTDLEFVTNNFYPPTIVTAWTQKRLVDILYKMHKQLNDALILSREPEIYFTKAQLHALGGRLNDKYHMSDVFWGNNNLISEDAIKYLQTAATMHLPIKIFQESNSSRFYLDWLWKQPSMRKWLEKISLSKK